MTTARARPPYICCLLVALVFCGCGSVHACRSRQGCRSSARNGSRGKTAGSWLRTDRIPPRRRGYTAPSPPQFQPAYPAASTSEAWRFSHVCRARRNPRGHAGGNRSPSGRRKRSPHLRESREPDPYIRHPHVAGAARRPVRVCRLEVEPILSSGAGYLAGRAGGRRNRQRSCDGSVGGTGDHHRHVIGA